MSTPAYFIAGTDTEIGKTTISSIIIRALAARGLKTAAMKPVAAGTVMVDGIPHNEDVDALMASSNMSLPQDMVCPYLLNTPISPNLSAAQDGVVIDNARIVETFKAIQVQADAVIVEGVGGFIVPFTDSVSSADLAVALNLPVILVVGLRLGCISHALLTAEAIRARGLTIAGWVANRVDPTMAFSDGNITTLEKWLGAPRLGAMPNLQSFDGAEQYLDLSLLPDMKA